MMDFTETDVFCFSYFIILNSFTRRIIYFCCESIRNFEGIKSNDFCISIQSVDRLTFQLTARYLLPQLRLPCLLKTDSWPTRRIFFIAGNLQLL